MPRQRRWHRYCRFEILCRPVTATEPRKSTFDTNLRGNFEAQRRVGPFDDFDRPLGDARANRRGCNAAADNATGSKQGGSRRDPERRLQCTTSPTRLLGYRSRCAAFAALDFLARVKAPWLQLLSPTGCSISLHHNPLCIGRIAFISQAIAPLTSTSDFGPGYRALLAEINQLLLFSPAPSLTW
jgi:hypothetical protein